MAADMTDPKARADAERIFGALCTATNIHEASSQELLTRAEVNLLAGVRIRIRARLGDTSVTARQVAAFIANAAHEIGQEASE